ncbi:MAG: 4-hydroxythreonine-4-phosphate dehydrogenase PdxA [Gemmataceae bacterium]
MKAPLPRLLLTMGDVAGIGPEIIARAWPHLLPLCRPVVVGDTRWLEKALEQAGSSSRVRSVTGPGEEDPSLEIVPCLQATTQDLSGIRPAQVNASAGRASYDFLVEAIDRTLAGESDGIVTAPLHKESLHAGGVNYPGHTEILADRTGSREFAMVLYGDGLAVAHVTLHMALRDVFRHLTAPAVEEKIHLLNRLLPRLLDRSPRLAVAALNPHASDGGLFGDEEARILAPAIARARGEGVNVAGPYPADTLFVRAHRGEFDGIVALYHDEGHIAMKLRSGFRCVNISAGLPLVRTSVAHGTAYDIAWKGQADPSSLIEAVKVAAKLARSAPT